MRSVNICVMRVLANRMSDVERLVFMSCYVSKPMRWQYFVNTSLGAVNVFNRVLNRGDKILMLS